jgi:hypothetical protein
MLIAGASAIAAILAAAIGLRWKGGPLLLGLPRLGQRWAGDLFDTPRWALYRAAGIAWTGESGLGSVVGWVLAVSEGLARTGRLPSLSDAQERGRLIWVTLSVAVLAITGSLWLVLAAQAVAVWIQARAKT